ncbi:MAG: hypothetical protein LW720_02035 [Pirellula sp.]|nr:hypothetical protein [Pirellula sp.]
MLVLVIEDTASSTSTSTSTKNSQSSAILFGIHFFPWFAWNVPQSQW